MAVLTDAMKEHIVRALACYDRSEVVIKSLHDEFGVVVTRQQVHAYRIGSPTCRKLSKRLQVLFEQAREAFIADARKIPIAQQSYRLRVMQRTLDQAEKQGNTAVVAQLLEQAAKEVGGIFTNRRELTGAGGGPVESRTTVVDEQAVKVAAGELSQDY